MILYPCTLKKEMEENEKKKKEEKVKERVRKWIKIVKSGRKNRKDVGRMYRKYG